MSRPGFNRMIEEAENRKFDIILCKTQSRFTRDMEIVEKYIHNKFVLWQIRFVAIIDNVDTDVKGNKKARQINGLINEWFLEDISENIRAVLTSKRKQGKYIGSIPAYGYLKNPEDHNSLIIDYEAAEIVRRIYSMYLSGYGLFKITKALNEDGILNPTHHKIKIGVIDKPNSAKSGKLWSGFTLRTILTNAIYTGDMVQGINQNVSFKNTKQIRVPRSDWIIVPNTHEPIIDKDTFHKVQELMTIKSRPQKNTFMVHPLTGKTKCYFCGGSMHKNIAKGRHYLRCYTNSRKNQKRCSHGIQLQLVEEVVLTRINKLIEAYRNDLLVEKSIIEKPNSTSRIDRLYAQLKELHAKCPDVETLTTNLYMDRMNGVISKSQFISISRTFAEQKTAVEIEIEKVKSKIEQFDPLSESEIIESKAVLVQKYSKLKALDRDVVAELIDYISVGKTDNNTIYIDFYWNI